MGRVARSLGYENGAPLGATLRRVCDRSGVEFGGPLGKFFSKSAHALSAGLACRWEKCDQTDLGGTPHFCYLLSIFLLVKSILYICTGPVAFSRSLNVATVLVPVSSNPRYVTA